MKYFKIALLCCLSIAIVSCEDEEKRQAETIKAARQNDSILKIISSNWKFSIPAPTPKVQQRISTWNEWTQFKSELMQKPTGGIAAYRQKTKNLVNKADQLRNNIPLMFDKPQVRSRLGVLITKTKQLYTFLNLQVIQDVKVLSLLGEITNETISVQNQLDEIIRISEIPKEMGEEEMLRALDTVRMANPDRMPQPEQRTLQQGVEPEAQPYTPPAQQQQLPKRKLLLNKLDNKKKVETGNNR